MYMWSWLIIILAVMSATCTMKCAVIRPSVTNVADHLSHAYFDCLMTILVLSLLPLSFSFCYSTILPSLSSFSQRAMLIWLSFLDLLRRTWMTCWYRSSLTSLHPWRGSCKPFVFGLETKLSWEWGWFGVGMRLVGSGRVEQQYLSDLWTQVNLQRWHLSFVREK